LSHTANGIAIAMLLLVTDELPHAPTGASLALVIPTLPAAPPAPTVAAAIKRMVPRPIAGWIVDESGLPLTGVHVTLRDAAGAIVDTADSEAGGAFRIDRAVVASRTLLLDGAPVFAAEVPWHGGDPAPKIMLARRARLDARVTARGIPIAGAEVHLTDGSRPTLATAVSDRDGVVHFEDLVPGPYELWARHDTAVSALARVVDVGAQSPADLVLALEPGGSVHGQVVADDRVPAGTTVQLTPLDVDHAVRLAQVDDHGRFAVDGIPPGRWRVEGDAAGYVDDGDQVIDSRGRGDVTVRLHRAGIVSGTVLDEAGAAVANATIVLRQQGASAPVEERTIASSTRLRWVHPLAGKRLLPVRDSLRFGAPRPGTRPAECGQGHCGVDLGSQRGNVIHAAADGEIALAFAEIRGEAGRYVAVDHGDGIRTFYMHMDELRPGLEVGQRVRAGDPLGTIGQTGFATGPHLHFAITQEQRGRTWYIDPEPILRHAVVLPVSRALDPIDTSAGTVIAAVRSREPAGTAAIQKLTTDVHGKFRIENVPPGSYVAVAFASDLAPGTSASFGVRSGDETADLVVTVRPGVMLHGRVIGRDGPIAGATVVAGSNGESAHKLATAYSDRTGEFALRALSGEVVLSVSAPGYGLAERTIFLDEGATRARPREEFVLTTENAQLRGQVLAPDGGTAGVVAIRIIDGGTQRRASTDAAGRFTIDRVASGSYSIELTSTDYPPTRATVVADRFQEVRLAQAGGIRLQLRDSHGGTALANARIVATGPEGRVVNQLTSAQGTVELRALMPGEWTLQARAPGYAADQQVVTVRAARVLQDAVLELSRGVTLEGVVRDRYGRRVGDARVWIGGATTRSDRDGNFRLLDARPGAGWLEAEHEGSHGAIQLQLAPGDERHTLGIELAE
jgi:murein DD-endopeptidase MepM/ murein hydrolase activator NlpD